MTEFNYKRLRLMRAAARVQRMHTLPTLYRQSVGEHTFGVLAILLTIVESPSAELMRAALYHDASEGLLGDTPAPMKWRYPNIEQALKQAEALIDDRFDIACHITDEEFKVLKYCDLMELTLFCIEEAMDGNRKMYGVGMRALRAIKERDLVSVTTRATELFEHVGAWHRSINYKGVPPHDWPEQS